MRIGLELSRRHPVRKGSNLKGLLGLESGKTRTTNNHLVRIRRCKPRSQIRRVGSLGVNRWEYVYALEEPLNLWGEPLIREKTCQCSPEKNVVTAPFVLVSWRGREEGMWVGGGGKLGNVGDQATNKRSTDQGETKKYYRKTTIKGVVEEKKGVCSRGDTEQYSTPLCLI